MTTVYVLTQKTYCDGNFGDLEVYDNVVLGVYSSIVLAEKAMNTIEVIKYCAQFGNADQTCVITAIDLDNISPVNAARKPYDYSDMDDD